jgi:hypothetical protein
MAKFIFIINSAIWLDSKPLSYSKGRTVFSPQQRVEQTLRTISSIRHYVPNAKIICLEIGKRRELTGVIEEQADEFYFLGDKKIVRMACDSRFKNLGEALTFLKGYSFLKNKGDFYFKLSGRYFLNEDFNLLQWDLDKFNMLKTGSVMSTRLYGFSASLLPLWRRTLLFCLPLLLANRSIEWSMPWFVPKRNINYLQGKIGVAGNIGPDGSFIQE